MALYRITIKRSVNGVRLEKGMFVELPSSTTNPLGMTKYREQVVQLFKTKYGVDVAKARAIGTSMMDIEKI